MLLSLKSFGQNYSLELSNTVFRNTFNTEGYLIDIKSAFNTSTALSVIRETSFGKTYLGVGYTTFNYFTQVDESEFGPSDPAFEGVFDKKKSNGHRFISIPIGVKFKIGESFYLPLQVGSHFEIEDESEIFNDYFISLSSGLSYITYFNESFYLDVAPMIDVFLFANEDPNIFATKMPFSYGVRVALGYKL